VEDVIGFAQDRLRTLDPRSPDDIRHADGAVVSFSPQMRGVDREIKEFLYVHMYRHPDVMRIRESAAQVVRDLFCAYSENPDLMGGHWSHGIANLDSPAKKRRIADYLAGMTDNFALEQHRRLFDHTPELR